jgi:uncharacterized protein DUF1844
LERKMSEERSFEVIDKRRIRAQGEGQEASAGTPGAATPQPPEASTADASTADASTADTSTAEAGQETPTEEEFQEEEFRPEQLLNPLLAMDVSNVLLMTIGLLADKAWIYLGLVPNPLSQQIEQNLPEARRAIDVVADLAKHLERAATPEEQRELQVLVSNLRANFVKQSNQGS